jgi:hypothetical protein
MCGHMSVCVGLDVCAQNVGHILIFKFPYFFGKSQGTQLWIEIDEESACIYCSLVFESNMCLTLQLFVATESPPPPVKIYMFLP